MKTNLLIHLAKCSILFFSLATFNLSAQTTYIAAPNNGPTGGGTPITINITNNGDFNNTDAILFNGISVSFAKSGSTVSFTSIAGSGSSVVIEGRKTNAAGALQWTANFSYNAPSFSGGSITPASGPTAGGTSVTVTGSNFGPSGRVTGVTVGGTAATAVTNTQTSVNFTTPAHSAGTVSIVITVGPTSPATGSQNLTIGTAFIYDAVLSNTLVDLKIEKQNKSNVITWITADEKNLRNCFKT